jgi:glycerate kinase
MRVLVACDKFKGSLSAVEAAAAMAAGVADSGIREIDCCPIADGGEGFTEAMRTALGGFEQTCEAGDPLGRTVICRYVVAQSDGHRIGVLEMAEASGFWRVGQGERAILRASTFGTGELIRHLAEFEQVDRILLGIGGSATNDGGAGMAAALGVVFRDADGEILVPCPEDLERTATIDLSGRIRLPEIIVACDVDNPLLGERGATAVFGPQKGAGPAEQQRLEAYLTRLVELTGEHATAEIPGAGAAGGMGFGLMVFAGARLVSGFDLVAEAVGLRGRVAAADLVLTGEGSLDAQTLDGKGPAGVARLAGEYGKRVVAYAGIATAEARESGIFPECHDLASLGLDFETCMTHAAELLREQVAATIF